MMKRYVVVTVAAAVLMSSAWETRFSPRAAAQGPATRGSAPSQSQSMQDMMKLHEQMMAQMKAWDATLDGLVKEMDAARGDAKVSAIAAVVAELVRQNKLMHEHMGQMRQQMMGGRGMMMNR